MQRRITVNLGNLVLSLSDAMELASPLLIQHRQRTAYVVPEMGKVAGLPNERLNGSGYPFHSAAAELGIGARIMMVADIFTALAEDRPYRKGMTKKEVMRILNQFSDIH
jgi:HD-GYP domain-containing protein (c-di-GMP phosphodiesterase class II)